ncbi:MAG: Fe-S-containing hydro-lyase [Chitinispirillaceae bacterium]
MSINQLETPLDEKQVADLKAGDTVYLSGVIYTARDAAHKRLTELLDKNEPLPVDLKGQVVYYAGPTPAAPGRVIGSAGPTTASRMDRYAPALIRRKGLRGMIGKGNRDAEVIEAMKECGCIYFAATGGAGALISTCIKKADVVCYEELGPEAIYRLEVENMPLTVAIDAKGNSLYESGPEEYRRIASTG